MEKVKLGQPTPQFLNTEHETVLVVFKDAKKSGMTEDIYTVNASHFDAKTMARVNDKGQLVDEYGRVYKDQMPEQDISSVDSQLKRDIENGKSGSGK
jgi:hypothetical protein